MEKKKVVIALGGNALGKDIGAERSRCKDCESDRRPCGAGLGYHRNTWKRPAGRHDPECDG